MDKFSYKNTPLGKAFTKAQSAPPPPPTPSDSLGVYTASDDSDVVTRRYKSSFIQSITGGKGYLQYDKSTNKIRFQLDVKTPEGNVESANTGWVKPNAVNSDMLAAAVGRAVTKSGKGQKLTPEEEQEYKGAIGQLASDLINFEKLLSKPKADV
jgi:hypothetical protein